MSYLKLAGIVASLGAMAVSSAAAVSAAEPTTSMPVSVVTSDGIAGWASSAYISSHPDFLAGQQAAATAMTGAASMQSLRTPLKSSSPIEQFSVQNADGCNSNVCISISGKGRVVNNWDTHAFGNVGCTSARFVRNGTTLLYTDPVCPNSSSKGVYYYYLGGPSTQPNNSKLCNAWDRISGYPCETVHS